MTNIKNFPADKARIDAKAKAYMAEAQAGLTGAFSGAEGEWLHGQLNGLRGMCPDGCCGGITEMDEPTLRERVIHDYVGLLIRRSYELFPN